MTNKIRLYTTAISFALGLPGKLRANDISRDELDCAVDLLRSIKTSTDLTGCGSTDKSLGLPTKLDKLTDLEAVGALLAVFQDLAAIRIETESDEGGAQKIFSQLSKVERLSRLYNQDLLQDLRIFRSRFDTEISNPDHVPSPGYAQEGEDLVVERMFPADMRGFYVDVGAHHPTRFSNTYRFYRRGWRGINIDPRPGIMELFDQIRPKDINHEAAVGFQEPGLTHAKYISFKEPAYNSIYIDDIEEVKNTIYSEIVSISDVEIQTLDNILDLYAGEFSRINLLSIDVEGFEMQVLNGFSIDKHKPDVIVIEVRGFDLNHPEKSEEYSLLSSNGYKLRSVLFHSLIFERADRQ